MRSNILLPAILGLSLAATSCHTHQTLSSVSLSRIVVDSRYDARPNAQATAFVTPYSHQVDSLMRPVVGRVARYMAKSRPESTLSNLLSDILLHSAQAYGEQPAFAVYNMGGIRAALAEGEVDLGDVLDVAPFENKICFLTLTGQQVTELFTQIARRGGEGVSHGVQLVITHDGQLRSARLNGEEIEPGKAYRVVTLDYLAQGNDQLTAFKRATDVKSPEGKDNNVREIIARYFKQQTARGIVVDSQVEGRITIE